ncbi:MAG: aminotransferase class III-fold pyridoxal phosphate-dependent enzyme, partial [Rickettsiales bacterium]|nr:aminotransferase class III-fold pyridoxal phosphate-dependent enzyme [Rickettsiales bacterium]
MRTVAIIQARMNSSRLPGKVLMDLGGMPVLAWCVRAAKHIPGVDQVMVATSVEDSDTPVAQWCEKENVLCTRGPLDDVLARFAQAARATQAEIVLRLTADCPLLDAQLCGEVLQLLKRTHADYASNAVPRQWPDGTDCEVFTADALFAAEAEANMPALREHVTPFIRNNQHRFKVKSLACPLPGLGVERWTLDNAEDYAFLKDVVAHLPRDRAPSYLEVLDVLAAHALRELHPVPDLPAAGVAIRPVSHGFAQSKLLLADAEHYIPQGSQTYSKSARQFPAGHAPLFLTHGEGSRVWDVDGNEYVDLISGLLPVVLGYCDPDVDYAIASQLSHGITFSLPTVLETELARRMGDMVPCAEKVRFAKNGSDATSAAIRIARAFTGRERVMVCGYHGWQDWYIGSTSRHKGVPQAVQALTHTVAYNDLAAVEKMLLQHKGEFAAMIMEPVNAIIPDQDYLKELKKLLHAHGTLLVFDEVITGFRLAKGGAQEYFGVTPDLASFGKAMGNGMPISALAGRADVMAEMEQVFFSGTFGGEALSLAACIAVLDKIQREPVIETLWANGRALREGVAALVHKHALEPVVVMKGLDPWILLDFLPQPPASREAMKTFFVTQM